MPLYLAIDDGKFNHGGGSGGSSGPAALAAAVVVVVGSNWQQKWLAMRALMVA